MNIFFRKTSKMIVLLLIMLQFNSFEFSVKFLGVN